MAHDKVLTSGTSCNQENKMRNNLNVYRKIKNNAKINEGNVSNAVRVKSYNDLPL